MSEPYRRFLASTDVDDWSACLDELERAVGSAADDEQRANALAEGLCVAIYLSWLADASGAPTVSDLADVHLRGLRALVLDAPRPDTVAWRRCLALVLLSDGYPIHARAVLGEDGIPTPEFAVLLVRGDDVRRLVELHGYVRGTPPTTFLPALYDYTYALVNVGGMREAQQVLETGGWADDDPLLIELQGAIDERLGQWAAAYATYCRSPWPEHRFRAAVVGTIAGQRVALDVDESIRRLLLRGQSELDQAGMVRSMAFLNACLWQRVESWILEHELGSLCFRRRQFTEADIHLSRALLSAPEGAQYAIAALRFSSLSWLTGPGPQLALSLQPEALAAAAEALRLGGEDDSTADARLWVAARTGDASVLPAAISDWPAYERARAYAQVDAPARAIDALIEAIEIRFNHRAFDDLMGHLHAAGLVGTVAKLADIVFREAATDFFALWETCLTLQHLRDTDDLMTDDSAIVGGSKVAGTVDDELVHLTDRFRDRLVELSQLEFMNAIRTCDVVILDGYADLAEELLLRAAKQAEGVSELLAVAVQRRTDIPRGVHSDQEALSCLARARDVARDRLERLQIARELCCYGAIREGRSILQQEVVFSSKTPLSHSEMIVVLQCAQWCTDVERRDIAARAAEQIGRDEAADVLGPYPEQFSNRLLATVRQFAPTTAVPVRSSATTGTMLSGSDRRWSGDAADGWADARTRLDELLGSDDEAVAVDGWADADAMPGVDELLGSDDHAVAADLTAHLDELSATGSFGLRLLAVDHLRAKLARLQQEAREVLPTVPAQLTPVERWYRDLKGPRIIQLCDLWRSRILNADDSDLDTFLADEQQFATAWEERRDVERSPIWRRIVQTADALQHALTNLVDADEPTHPILRDLRSALRLDIERLVGEAAEQAAAASRNLDSPPVGGAA